MQELVKFSNATKHQQCSHRYDITGLVCSTLRKPRSNMVVVLVIKKIIIQKFSSSEQVTLDAEIYRNCIEEIVTTTALIGNIQ